MAFDLFQGYTIDPSTPPSISDVQRRQKLADMLAQQGYVEDSGGLGVLAQALAGGVSGYERKYAAQEAQAGLDSSTANLGKALSGGYDSIEADPSSYVQALANPFLPQSAAQGANAWVTDRAQSARQTAENAALLQRQQATPTRGSAPSGYRWTSDGSALEPVPGGPADPDSAQGLTPEALDLIATQYLAGDKSAITGYARNANMRAQIANAVAEKANAAGMDGKAIAAEVSAYGGNVAAQRSAGTRAAQVGMAASEANQMADIALDASKAVPRTSFVPWNAAVNAVATNTSSPEMAAFVTATTSLVNAYARAISPLGAPTDAMRQHAEEMLNTAQGPEAYAAVIAQMKREMEAALNAPAEISGRLKTSITGTPPTATPDQSATDWQDYFK